VKKNLTYLLFIIIPFALALIAYFLLLPDQIPIQLTTNGLRYVDKGYIFLFASAPVILYWGYQRKHK